MNPYTGRRWLFLKWWCICGPDGSAYLLRLFILRTPWFQIMLHFFFRPDADRDLHDHPWPFMTFVLRGSYVEEHMVAGNFRHINWFAYHPRDSVHRIDSLLPGCCSLNRRSRYFVRNNTLPPLQVPVIPVITLVLTGTKTRNKRWGFYTPGGFIPHDQYKPDSID